MSIEVQFVSIIASAKWTHTSFLMRLVVSFTGDFLFNRKRSDETDSQTMKLFLRYVAILAIFLFGVTGCEEQTARPNADQDSVDADVIVVGGGIAGLAAALELGRGGASVLILDMNSVAGGHAVKAGGWALVDTALQRTRGIEDSPELAFNDLMAWGETNDSDWTRFYVENSNSMIYEYLTQLGVEFVVIIPTPEHSVTRFHFTKGRSVNVVVPMLKALFELPQVKFEGNMRVDELVVEDGAVTGVIATNLRGEQTQTYSAQAVVMATGGFQSNLELVRETWNGNLTFPDRLLIGSGQFAGGNGYALAEQAGAALTNLEKHTTFINGIPNPRDPSGERALVTSNPLAIWVNAEGNRFADESRADKFNVPAVLEQTSGTYWAIFDAEGRKTFGVRDALWLDGDTIANEIVNNDAIVQVADSIDALAREAKLPGDALGAAVERYNGSVEQGSDDDFARSMTGGRAAPKKIETPPFYAVQLYPVTRKSMGGIAIDMSARALDESGKLVPGLYAAGEVTGAAGINGSVGMSGTFLGPSLMTGRIAGQTAVADLAVTNNEPFDAIAPVSDQLEWEPDFTREDLVALLEEPRPGFWHFETAHSLVLERDYECTQCHSATVPMEPAMIRSHLLAQTEICGECH